MVQTPRRQQRPVAPVSPSVSPPLGSVEGLSSPDPVEHSPGSQPPSPGPAISPAPADLDPEAVRGAPQEFVQELRGAQRERVRGEGLQAGALSLARILAGGLRPLPSGAH